MDKKIFFVGKQRDNFLVDAMIKALSNAQYEVLFSEPDPEGIAEAHSHGEDMPDIFIVYLDGDETNSGRALAYLKLYLLDPKRKRFLFLVGNATEINGAYRYISKGLVTYAFLRPVNAQDLISRLQMVNVDYTYSIEEEKKEEEGEASKGGKDKKDKKEKKDEIDPNKKNILIVDDDSTFLHASQHWFSKAFNAFIVNSGLNAVSFLRSRQVDLILLDYEMPSLSGLEVFNMIKSEPATESIPVIFLTSKNDKDTVTEVLSSRPAGYLIKSKPPAVLVQTVSDFFENQRKAKAEEERRKAEEKLSAI